MKINSKLNYIKTLENFYPRRLNQSTPHEQNNYDRMKIILSNYKTSKEARQDIIDYIEISTF